MNTPSPNHRREPLSADKTNTLLPVAPHAMSSRYFAPFPLRAFVLIAFPRSGIIRVYSRLFVVFLLFLFSAFFIHADTATVFPSADSYIKDDAPDSNYNADAALFAGKTAATTMEVRRSFIQFDLTGQIPPGAVIQSATLTIVVTRVPTGGAVDATFALRKLLQPWVESQVTWNSRFNGVSWTLPGADDSSDTVTVPSATLQMFGLVGSYSFAPTPQLVADVQDWVSNPGNNNGWLLVSQDEVTLKTGRRIGAREDTLNSPQLVITYTVPSVGVTVNPPSQNALVGSTVTFTANGSGVPPLSYQWLFEGAPLNGETANTLALNNVQTNQSGNYAVVLTTGSGSITSAPAILTVSPPLPGLPVVRIITPTNGSRFPAHADIPLAATATETNGVIARVDFLLGSNVVGSAFSEPYQFLLTNVAAGNYLLTARAVDARGTNGISPAIAFSVFNPPSVTLSSPSPGTHFPFGTNVVITASISGGASPVRAEFFAANPAAGTTNSIGILTNAPFTMTWLRPAPGDYFLFVTATDALGQTAISTNVPVRIFIPELVLPTIDIVSGPGDFSTVSTPIVSFSGTAADNIGVDHVDFQVFSGHFLQTAGSITTASGTTSWTATVPLAPGQNAVRFRSVDLAGNRSAPITRNVTYNAKDQLTIQINGDGKVSPNLNQRTLNLGKIYHVTAKPGKASIFAGWTNGVVTNAPRISFEMRTNLVLVANFIPNPFPAVAGTYAGLFFDPDPLRFRPEDAGSLTLQLAKRGTFTGKVQILGRRYGFHGQFDVNGNAKLGVLRRGLAPLVLALQIDLTNKTERLSGTLTVQVDANSLSSVLTAVRKASGKGTAPRPPFVGDASFNLVSESDPPAQPGSLTVHVSNSGGVKFKGVLKTSEKFNAAAIISSAGDVPCYISKQKGAELLIGWLLLNSTATNTSDLLLISPPVSSAILLTVQPVP